MVGSLGDNPNSNPNPNPNPNLRPIPSNHLPTHATTSRTHSRSARTQRHTRPVHLPAPAPTHCHAHPLPHHIVQNTTICTVSTCLSHASKHVLCRPRVSDQTPEMHWPELYYMCQRCTGLSYIIRRIRRQRDTGSSYSYFTSDRRGR